MQTETYSASLNHYTARVTAFTSFGELVRACTEDGYVPTLRHHRGDNAAVREARMTVREELTARGLAVWPAVA